jgi:hypothetical protein
MSRNPDRNYDIAAASLAGEPLQALADQYQLHIKSVRRIVEETRTFVLRRGNRMLPVGLTTRAAIAIEDAIGLWPRVELASKIRARRLDILRSPFGRRQIILEIDAWLQECDVGSRAPADVTSPPND